MGQIHITSLTLAINESAAVSANTRFDALKARVVGHVGRKVRLAHGDSLCWQRSLPHPI